MAHIIKANPRDLERLENESLNGRIVPLRQVHGRYLPVLQAMARHWVAAKAEFARNSDERTAGRKAAVWTAVIRTQRTMTEADLRRIVREEMAVQKRVMAENSNT